MWNPQSAIESTELGLFDKNLGDYGMQLFLYRPTLATT